LYPTFRRNVWPPYSGSKNSLANQRASHPEDGGDTFLRNVGYHSTHYTALYPRRRYSSKPLLWKPQILHVKIFTKTHRTEHRTHMHKTTHNTDGLLWRNTAITGTHSKTLIKSSLPAANLNLLKEKLRYRRSLTNSSKIWGPMRPSPKILAHRLK
jgi:hypothetical protein